MRLPLRMAGLSRHIRIRYSLWLVKFYNRPNSLLCAVWPLAVHDVPLPTDVACSAGMPQSRRSRETRRTLQACPPSLQCYDWIMLPGADTSANHRTRSRYRFGCSSCLSWFYPQRLLHCQIHAQNLKVHVFFSNALYIISIQILSKRMYHFDNFLRPIWILKLIEFKSKILYILTSARTIVCHNQSLSH